MQEESPSGWLYAITIAARGSGKFRLSDDRFAAVHFIRLEDINRFFATSAALASILFPLFWRIDDLLPRQFAIATLNGESSLPDILFDGPYRTPHEPRKQVQK